MRMFLKLLSSTQLYFMYAILMVSKMFCCLLFTLQYVCIYTHTHACTHTHMHTRMQKVHDSTCGIVILIIIFISILSYIHEN